MGQLSRGEFIRKWVAGDNAGTLGAADRAAMVEDLDALITYSGGDPKKADQPTAEEAARGVLSSQEESKRREAEYNQPGSYLGRMRRS